MPDSRATVVAPARQRRRRREPLRALHRPVPSTAPRASRRGPAPVTLLKLEPAREPIGTPRIDNSIRLPPPVASTTPPLRALGVAAAIAIVGLVGAALTAIVQSPAEADAGQEVAASETVEARWVAARLPDAPAETTATTELPMPAALSGSVETASVAAPARLTTPVVPDGGVYTDLIARYFGELTIEALVIVQCESTFRPNAIGTNRNGTRDHGLFQINDVHRATFERVMGQPWSEIYDPELNTRFALWLHARSGGWGPWTCNRSLVAYDDR